MMPPEPHEQAVVTPDEAPTGQLLTGAVGDRCVNCGSPLAADQRYCVQCGERRGTSRLSAAKASGQAAETRVRGSEPPSQANGRRPSYGTTLVAGVATLLLAMGVGVEIGRISNANSGSRAAAQPQVITVGGGSGTGRAAAAATGGTTAKTPTGTGKHAKHVVVVKTEAKKAAAAAAAPKPTQQAVQKAAHAANGVLGGNAGQSNNTVTTGGQCAAGSAGCDNGKFTGNFFGGG
jgi:hypothetical protein